MALAITVWTLTSEPSRLATWLPPEASRRSSRLMVVVEELTSRGVLLQDVVLVSNPVVAGIGHPVQSCPEQLAVETAEVLRVLPESLAGILISVGRQPTHQAGLNLASVRELSPGRPLSFFVGRSATVPALSVWRGEPAQRTRAQCAVSRRLAELATMSPAARATA